MADTSNSKFNVKITTNTNQVLANKENLTIGETVDLLLKNQEYDRDTVQVLLGVMRSSLVLEIKHATYSKFIEIYKDG